MSCIIYIYIYVRVRVSLCTCNCNCPRCSFQLDSLVCLPSLHTFSRSILVLCIQVKGLKNSKIYQKFLEMQYICILVVKYIYFCVNI